MVETLINSVISLISGNGFRVYSIEPVKPGYPYAVVGSPLFTDRDGGKDKTYYSGTLDIYVNVTTNRTNGSNKHLYSYLDLIKTKIKPSEGSTVDLGTAYTNTVLYMSQEFVSHKIEEKRTVSTGKLTYYFEIETN